MDEIGCWENVSKVGDRLKLAPIPSRGAFQEAQSRIDPVTSCTSTRGPRTLTDCSRGDEGALCHGAGSLLSDDSGNRVALCWSAE